MNKYLLVSVIVIISGCGSYPTEQQIQDLRIREAQAKYNLKELKKLVKVEEQRLALTQLKVSEKEGTEIYILELKVYQSHFSLNVSKHIADSINSFRFKIPVDKRYYDSVKIGDSLSSKFRMGSLIMKGSIGSNHVRVVDKEIVPFLSSIGNKEY